MTRLESILRNTLFSFISRAIDVGVTFALAILLARYLGPKGMGEYTYIIAFVALFVPLIDLGLDHILIREIAKRRDTAKTYVGAALLLKLLIILILLPIGMVATWLFGDKSVDQWAIFLCFVGTLFLREIPTVVSYAVFLAYERKWLSSQLPFWSSSPGVLCWRFFWLPLLVSSFRALPLSGSWCGNSPGHTSCLIGSCGSTMWSNLSH
jgi:hypothetical protein